MRTARRKTANPRDVKGITSFNLSYHDAEGELRFEVCRLDPKSFFQRRPNLAAPDKWIRILKGVELVPYRLPELITAAKAGETVFIAEREKDVAAWWQMDSRPLATRKARANGRMLRQLF